MIDRVKEVKEVGDQIGDEIVTELGDLVNHLKKAQPSLQPLVTYFEGELTKLKNELHADATIKEIQEIMYALPSK